MQVTTALDLGAGISTLPLIAPPWQTQEPYQLLLGFPRLHRERVTWETLLPPRPSANVGDSSLATASSSLECGVIPIMSIINNEASLATVRLPKLLQRFDVVLGWDEQFQQRLRDRNKMKGLRQNEVGDQSTMLMKALQAIFLYC